MVSTKFSSVMFQLLYKDDFIGQTVTTSKFEPMAIISIDVWMNKIYGFYPNANSESNFPWSRQFIGLVTAADGSITTEVIENG